MNWLEMAPFLMKLTDFFRVGLDAWDRAPFVEGVAEAILVAAAPWDPVIRGVHVLEDDATRRHGAWFLAGIVCTLKRHGA